MKVLVVEDDEMIAEGVVDFLSEEGCQVTWVGEGRSVSKRLLAEKPDLVMLDLGLPGKDGLEVLKEMRSLGIATPVLVTTARDTVEDRVRGLDSGADDYLVKPYDLAELSARLRALLRRADAGAAKVFDFGVLKIFPDTREVVFEGRHIILSDKEYRLLSTLAEGGDRVFSRYQLYERLQKSEAELASNAVEVHVHNLRKKLSDTVVKTIRGIGYQFGY